MSVPKFNKLMRPFLYTLRDGNIHSLKDIKEDVSEKLKINQDDRQLLLPSGNQSVFDNRIGWARSYLKKSGLIESPSKAEFVITDIGRKALEDNPVDIDIKYLEKFESFLKFHNSSKESVEEEKNDKDETPQDILDNAYNQIEKTILDDILNTVYEKSPEFFERLVVKLLLKMGYGGTVENAGIVIGKSGDDGIDGIIKEDKLGFDLIYIQAKKWDLEKSIGRPEIQKFVGALAGKGANNGLFITTSKYFTKEAIEYAKRQHITKVILVNGIQLAKLMFDHDLGVSLESTYEIKKIDSDFFEE